MRRIVSKLMCGLATILLTAVVNASFVEEQNNAGKPAPRLWADKSDKLILTGAIFVELKDGKVRLLRSDGTSFEVDIRELCATDQEYVRKQSNVTKSSVAPPVTGTPPTAGSSVHFYEKCQQICDDLSKTYTGTDAARKPTIAVLEFPNLSGGVSTLGQLLPEELITKFFATGKYKVIERLLLKKVMAEHNLQFKGLIDPKSAKELGKILGVDAIASGTVTDTEDSLRVNARLISTETGEILSVAVVSITKDDWVKGILGATDGVTPISGSTDTGPTGKVVRLPFRDDFSKYDDGATTDWGPAAKVTTGADSRKWLCPAGKGQKPIGCNVELPDNGYIEFDYNAQQLESRKNLEKVLSGITLIDEAGAKYRIEWTIFIREKYSEYILKLPGGTNVSEYDYDDRWAAGTIRILKAGNTITIHCEGSDHKLEANVSDFKKFTRFEVDIYKGPNSMISFTNFKIGKIEGSGSPNPRNR